MELKRQLGLTTGILVVVADMIGVGIFMTTGNILGMTHNALTVLVLWLIGGVIAITGALSYAELATMWPDVGGEYVYLKKIFGFLPAFLTGWISLVVGFSTPVATGSLLLVQYVNKLIHNVAGSASTVMFLDGVLAQKVIAACIILFFGIMHMRGVKGASNLQNFLTLLKILIVVSLVGFGMMMIDFKNLGRLTAQYPTGTGGSLGIPGEGLALLIVMFAYSGWNSASYIAGEIKNPERCLPRALLFGTLITMFLYLLLNAVFLLSAPGEAIMGKDEIGAIATTFLFGANVSTIFTLSIAIVLLSSISVQMMVGPRVYYAMAKDRMIFSSISKLHPRFETPWRAIIIQMCLSIFYVFTGSAMTLVIYMGFALNIFPVMAVIGMIYFRYKKPEITRPYRVPLYPVIPLIYLTLSIGMMIAALMNWTTTSLFAIGVVVAGIPVFYLWQWGVKKNTLKESI